MTYDEIMQLPNINKIGGVLGWLLEQQLIKKLTEISHANVLVVLHHPLKTHDGFRELDCQVIRQVLPLGAEFVYNDLRRRLYPRLKVVAAIRFFFETDIDMEDFRFYQKLNCKYSTVVTKEMLAEY